MGKHKQLNQSHVYKISSTRIIKAKYRLWLTPDQARKNDEYAKLNSNQTLRFIQKWENKECNRPNGYDREDEIHKIKTEIALLEKYPSSKPNGKKVSDKYDKLNELLFTPNYIMVTMDNKGDIDKLCMPKGFRINDVKYKRLLATTGGGKKSTVIFVSEPVFPDLCWRLDMGRDLSKEMIPAKLEAYKALTCSASYPVSNPKGVLIVPDAETTFKANVIEINDTETELPVMKQIKDYLIEKMKISDGCGLILPYRCLKWGEDLGIEGFFTAVIRNGYTKGTLNPFDFIKFAETEAHNYFIPDAWGVMRDVRNYDIIIPTSMMKLWDSYNSLEHVHECWEKYGYDFSVTKTTSGSMDNVGDLNYQFIQSLKLTDSEIDELIDPTVTEIKEVLGGDHRKTLLYLKGKKIGEKDVLSSEPDFVQALMIDKQMINDPFVRNQVYKMIRRRIDDAKTGVLRVKGNFSMMSGDPYALCQCVFGMEVTGLLRAGEFYSNYWTRQGIDKVAAFRAPMTNHNNIRIFRLVDSPEMADWYKYMKNITILNSWDTTTHALNGADFDGDQVFTTNNRVIMDNVLELDAIVCIQKPTKKVVPTEEDLIKANKNSFGDAIGVTTNRITAMFDILAKYEKGSPQYDEIMYRIMSGQMIQQNVIDKSKGTEAKEMPKFWYNPKLSYTPILTDEKGKAIKGEDGNFIYLPESEEQKAQREFNLELVVEKKPYFFIWKKDSMVLGEYKKYMENIHRGCIYRFGFTFDELMEKEKWNEAEQAFVNDYYRDLPVSIANSTMNRICWKVEEAFKDTPKEIRGSEFDPSILKTDKKYSQSKFKEMKNLYKQHNTEIKNYKIKQAEIEASDEDEKQDSRQMFVNRFREAALSICNNEEDLCNMVVDLCYNSNIKKQFTWDVAGKQIIRNLLRRNENTYSYPVIDELGNIEYAGDRFTMIKTQLEGDRY